MSDPTGSPDSPRSDSPVSPGALNSFIDGVEEKTRGPGERHVAAFCSSGALDTSRENAFADQDALNEWRENLPPEDTAVVVVFEGSIPAPDGT